MVNINLSRRMWEKLRNEQGNTEDLFRHEADCTSYFNGYLEAMSDLEKLEYNDGFNTSFPTRADKEKYFDVYFWIIKQMREMAFNPYEAMSAEGMKKLEDLPLKDLRAVASGQLGDPRYFEWVEEEEKP